MFKASQGLSFINSEVGQANSCLLVDASESALDQGQHEVNEYAK